MVNDAIYNEYGDELSMNAVFYVSRVDALISITENGQETSVHIQPEQMSRLLKWMVHYLEIFCWQEDYISREEPDCFDGDEWDDMDDETDADKAKIIDEPINWQLNITYRNGVSQQIVSSISLPDRVAELIWELMDYLYPDKNE